MPAANKQDKTVAPEIVSKLEAGRNFIIKNFRRRPGLDEIAAQAGISPFHFHRLFKKQFGETPKRVLSRLQATSAQQQILQGVPFAQIAKDNGYAHASHFTVRFRQATGMTPTQYRESLNKKAR